MKKLIYFIFVFLILFIGRPVRFALAQSTSYWSQCTDGASIVRCETYNCPNGDTNNDGRCTAQDTKAELTESRNDSFCANPASGCGEVLYYADKQNSACAVRVKESTNNCDLYKASTPNFGNATSTPTATPKPTATTKLNSSPVPTVKPVKTLPKTGPALWASIVIAALGIYGFYLYEKRSPEEK